MWKDIYIKDLFVWCWIILTVEAGVVRIRVPLTNKEAKEGDTVMFKCDVNIYPASENQNLKIQWKHNEGLIDITKNKKYEVIEEEGTLSIRDLKGHDSGQYTCIASIGSAKDRSSARLIVKTRPDPPKNVEMIGCIAHTAELMWNNGHDGGDKIKSFLVQYNTSENPNYWNNYYEEIPDSEKQTTLELAPWGTYSFRILAHNSVGYSEPSLPTIKTCTTPPDHPNGNPKNVRTLTHKKGKLIISWTPVPRLKHNGPGFRYLVSYRKKKSTYWNTQTVDKPDARLLEIDVNDIYGSYELKVQSVNDIGKSYQTPFVMTGRSGEAEPLVVPKDFRVDIKQRMEPHKAHFIWESVDISEDKIRGNFKGYKLRYWKSTEGRHKWKEVDIIVDVGNGYDLPDVRATIEGLPAYCALRAQVAVKNSHYTGPPSQTIDFHTPEGAPGPVRNLHTERHGAKYVLLKWLPPDEPNGILLGYDIGYQPVNGDKVGKVKALKPQITNPSTLGARITGLEPDKEYRFYVWARTKTDRGDPVFIDVKTADTAPDIPQLLMLDVDRTSVNVTWRTQPYYKQDVQYLLEYREQGEEIWISTDSEIAKTWKVIGDLKPYTKYEVKLVAMNKFGVTANSKTITIETNPTKAYHWNYDASSGQIASMHQSGLNIASHSLPKNLAFIFNLLLTLLTLIFVFH